MTRNFNQSGKRTPLWRSDQKSSPKRKSKSPSTEKYFLTIYRAFLEFEHILWEATKPTIVLTDNKSARRFFQTKAIPQALWIACDYVIQFNLKTVHITGPINTAVDLRSRIELNVKENWPLKTREDIQTTPNEVTASFSDVADEEQFFPPRQTIKVSQKKKPSNGKSNLVKAQGNG